ncbi:MAG: tol-pal system protein YbgF [Bdellovibrionota bacterium]
MSSKTWMTLICAGGLTLTGCRIGPPPPSLENQSDEAQMSSSMVREKIADQNALIMELESSIREMKGKIESLSFEMDQKEKQQQKVLEDFDFRLGDLEKKAQTSSKSFSQEADSSDDVVPASHSESILPPVDVAPKTPSLHSEISMPPVTEPAATGKPQEIKPSSENDEVSEYQSILDQFNREKNKSSSIQRFKIFVKKNPQSSLAPNAQYWIGEGHYVQGDYARAITAWQVVVDEYPKSNKTCDAILKQGLAFSKLKDSKNATLFLEEVIDRCPDSPSSEKAKAFLYKIKQES